MNERPLKAIQQIQLGTVLSTEQQARETLGRLERAGFEGIELNGFMTRPTPLFVRALTRASGMPVGRGGRLDWPELIRSTSLKVVGLHEDLGTVEREPDAVISRAASFDTRRVVITGMHRFDYTDEAQVRDLALRLNAAGRVLAAGNVSLLYHNHNVEFRRLPSGRTAFSVLIAETDPSAVNFEFDCYWPTAAGVDALALMRELGERVVLCHITDRGTRRRGSSLTPIDEADAVELGLGNMDIPSFIEQAKLSGTRAVILETHRNWIEGSPIRSFETSAKVLNRHLGQHSPL
ncbi:TIM barrel protein [Microbacterium sp. LMC-P-041]|nr:TIM barrel protein [Microbacterium sp. LMC-P-041]